MADVLWRRQGALRNTMLVLGGSAVLAMSAKIQLPFWPVAMTLQSLAIMLIGMTFGSWLGAATVLAYLAEGFAGLPVFAGVAAGPAYMAGPTGGYLLGYLLAVWVIGRLAERGWDRSVPRGTAAMAAGHILLFVPGVLWLAYLFGWEEAVAFGVTPFIAATVLKTVVGGAMLASFWSLISRGRA
jgi:biotin transport system substrate-specific component